MDADLFSGPGYAAGAPFKACSKCARRLAWERTVVHPGGDVAAPGRTVWGARCGCGMAYDFDPEREGAYSYPCDTWSSWRAIESLGRQVEVARAELARIAEAS